MNSARAALWPSAHANQVFAGAAAAGDDQVLVALEPLAGGELLEQPPMAPRTAAKSMSSTQACAKRSLAVAAGVLPDLALKSSISVSGCIADVLLKPTRPSVSSRIAPLRPWRGRSP